MVVTTAAILKGKKKTRGREGEFEDEKVRVGKRTSERERSSLCVRVCVLLQ